MSLKIAKAFTQALRQDEDLLTTLGATEGRGARIFAVARPDEDEKEDKVPYIIVMPNGVQSEGTKDDYEQVDRATVDLLICDESFDQLVNLASRTRHIVNQHLSSTEDYIIDDMSFTASAVQYDMARPCYYMTLTYIVSIN